MTRGKRYRRDKLYLQAIVLKIIKMTKVPKFDIEWTEIPTTIDASLYLNTILLVVQRTKTIQNGNHYWTRHPDRQEKASEKQITQLSSSTTEKSCERWSNIELEGHAKFFSRQAQRQQLFLCNALNKTCTYKINNNTFLY